MKAIIVPDKSMPKGVVCSHCDLSFKPGQVVIAEQVNHIGWFGWHKGCMRATLDSTPYDDYETIKMNMEKGLIF